MKQEVNASVITVWLIHTKDKDFTRDNNKGFNGNTDLGLFLKMNTFMPNIYLFCKPLNDVTKLLTIETRALAVPIDTFKKHFKVLANFTFYCN